MSQDYKLNYLESLTGGARYGLGKNRGEKVHAGAKVSEHF